MPASRQKYTCIEMLRSSRHPRRALDLMRADRSLGGLEIAQISPVKSLPDLARLFLPAESGPRRADAESRRADADANGPTKKIRVESPTAAAHDFGDPGGEV